MTVRWTVRAAAGVARRRLAQLLLRLRGDTVIDAWVPAGAVLSCFVKKVPKETSWGEAGVGMSSTQTPPPPKTPLWCVDRWCGGEFRCEGPSASLRFAQNDTPSVCMDRLWRCHFALQNDRAVREADPYEFYRRCERISQEEISFYIVSQPEQNSIDNHFSLWYIGFTRGSNFRIPLGDPADDRVRLRAFYLLDNLKLFGSMRRLDPAEPPINGHSEEDR